MIAVHAEASQVTFQGSLYHSVPTTFPIFPQQSIYLYLHLPNLFNRHRAIEVSHIHFPYRFLQDY